MLGAETRLHVPGKGGPLVWGDMEGRYKLLANEAVLNGVRTKCQRTKYQMISWYFVGTFFLLSGFDQFVLV